MHRHDRLCSFRDHTGYQIRIDVESLPFYIDKDWPRSEPRNRPRGSKKTKWSGDDFVARAYST